jgi:hypothetical protein
MPTESEWQAALCKLTPAARSGLDEVAKRHGLDEDSTLEFDPDGEGGASAVFTDEYARTEYRIRPDGEILEVSQTFHRPR